MKRIVAISDIHSNYVAFESAVKAIEKINPDGIIFLGDYVTDFPNTQKTMNLIYMCRSKYNCWFIRGNREDYLIEHDNNPNDGWCYCSSVGSLLYTYENLTKKDLSFFRKMPICLDISIDGCPTLTVCHGSPKSTKENILNNKPSQLKYINSINGDILICGHTHHRNIINICDKQIVFCPSLGLTQDNEKYGCSAITLLSCIDNKWKVEFLNIEFDADRLICDYKNSDLLNKAPVFARCIIKSIETNSDLAYKCVVLAWDYAKKDKFKSSGILPERYWEKAAKDLKLI